MARSRLAVAMQVMLAMIIDMCSKSISLNYILIKVMKKPGVPRVYNEKKTISDRNKKAFPSRSKFMLKYVFF